MRTCYRLYFHLLLSCFLELGICLLQLLMCTAVVTAAKSTVGGWRHKNSHSHVALSKPSKQVLLGQHPEMFQNTQHCDFCSFILI